MPNYRLLVTSTLLLTITSPAFAADEVPTSPPTFKWHPEFQFSTGLGVGRTDRDIGLPQIMIPMWQDDKSMLFTDLRYRFDNEQSQEYNLGVGVRKEINADWILGGYGFFDRLSSPDGFLYSQGTFGLEALSVTNDARINFYIPQSTTHFASGGGQVQITGNQLSIINSQERALPGADFELGQKLPIDLADLRIYAGGYRYAAENYGIEAGPRGKFELTLNDHYIPAIPFGAEVTLGAEIEHDNVRGTESFALLKFTIPLGGSGIHNTTDTLDERMNTFVQRDVDIIQKKGGVPEAAVNEYNNQTISNFSIVNANNDVPATIAAARTNSLIVLDGSAGTINIASGNNITMQSGQSLLGGGMTLALRGARTGVQAAYTVPGTSPTLSGSSNGGTGLVTLANNAVLKNVNVTNSGNGTIAVYGNTVSNISVSNNTLLDTGNSGYGIELDGNSSGIIQGNNITATNGNSRGIFINNPSGSFGPLTISNNIVTAYNSVAATSWGIQIAGAHQTTINENIINTSQGIGIESDGSDSTINNNTINLSNGATAGVYLTTGYSSGSTGSISNNIINIIGASSSAGIWVDRSSATVNNNTITDNITLGAMTLELASVSGSNNTYTGANPCFNVGSSGSIGFADGRHCP